MTNQPINQAYVDETETRDPRGPWKQTYTGKQVFPLRLTEDDVDIHDIAHSLSLICRYNGHCSWHYSVAEHSIRVCDILPNELKLQGLLHDAAEAYLWDAVRPFKSIITINGRPFKEIESEIMLTICTKYQLAYPFDPMIKRADNVLLATEKRDLMVESPDKWIDLPNPLDDVIVPATDVIIESVFLRYFSGYSDHAIK